MKIYINLIPPKYLKPWGGGIFFVKNLISFISNNHLNKIVYQLEKDINIILIIDPRNGEYKKYNYLQLLKYKQDNPSTKLIYRVNECDIKRAPNSNLEPIILDCIQKCDNVIFVSQWLKEYYFNKYTVINQSKCIHIIPGCNTNIYYPNQKLNQHIKTNKINKIKLVTHHWSNNYNKGFEIYNHLDQLLPQYPNIEFTYIGNYINNYQPKNIKIISALTGKELADEIRKNNIYLTASQYEPGGNHNIEGMACGLPILYRSNGGSIKEQSHNCGEEYLNVDDLLEKIKLIQNNYQYYISNIDYKYLSASRCCHDYITYFKNIT